MRHLGEDFFVCHHRECDGVRIQPYNVVQIYPLRRQLSFSKFKAALHVIFLKYFTFLF